MGDRYLHFDEVQPILTGELGPLKRYDLEGKNYDRRVSFTMVVFARNASAAIKRADQWRAENNRVRADKWTTRPGL